MKFPNKTCAPQRRIFKLSMRIRAGGPQLWRAVRARARARAKYPGISSKLAFLFYNFQNNQGTSCSAPRVWQLCKSSAQSEPISTSYDENNFASFYPLKMHSKNQMKIEFRLQFSRSQDPPLFKLSHTKKRTLKVQFKIDQTHLF